MQNFHLRVLVFTLVVIALSVVFSVVASYAMFLKVHSDVTTFAQESTEESNVQLVELRGRLKLLYEEMRSKGAGRFLPSLALVPLGREFKNSIRRCHRHGALPGRTDPDESHGFHRRFERGGRGRRVPCKLAENFRKKPLCHLFDGLDSKVLSIVHPFLRIIPLFGVALLTA